MADTPPLQQGMLALPVVTALKQDAAKEGPQRTHMERTISMDIREEREDLKKAAEQSLNAMMELDLEGKIRWLSPSWLDLTGTAASSLIGKPVTEILENNTTAFADCIESIRKDDSKSQIIRIAVKPPVSVGVEDVMSTESITPLPLDGATSEQDENEADAPPDRQTEQSCGIPLEAQGIMVYDRTTGNESHTMWMIKPSVSREITIDLPDVLVESLGIGAEMLANYLTVLADVGIQDPENHPPPLPVLCRICERQITPWWFEKHTELCSQEHRAEMEVQMAQESLNEQRSALVRVLDALEAQARREKGVSDSGSPVPVPSAEYKGMPIGPNSNPSSGPSSGRASPATGPGRSRDSSASGFGHHRARSFAVRRPLARIVELVLDLCDTAMEISTPAVRDTKGWAPGELRTQSPQSEGRIQQVLQWQSPSAGTLENEQGLAVLCNDTSHLAKAKLDAIFRHRQILEYSERIRCEYDVLVQECIEAALEKAARIAAGELSDSSESQQDSVTPDQLEIPEELSEDPLQDMQSETSSLAGSYNKPLPPSAMAMALRNNSESMLSRRTSSAGSSRASSPKGGAATPRSYGTQSMIEPYTLHKRGSLAVESDTGAESDGSVRSSIASGSHRRSNSPAAEFSLSRMVSTRSRERKRKSLVLPSLAASSRHQSPGRVPPAPSSPLRMAKPRLPSGTVSQGLPSPITSPVMLTSEFTSPVVRAQSQNNHHRRQSSAALSEAMGRPASPRLSAIQSLPQPRAVQTSIKDFEVIKPISKGAFGSVYLAKKKSTGDYYAIKVLNKSDMVAKNQVTNVKAERAIMMWQGESDFVAKLYWTFSSKDYLYLVMEYLNGGDCASLIKVLGELPEDWTQKYIAEVVLCVQHLHARQIVHRDLKPDNLLIDAKGHLKLTDFGLSRMGMIGRQKRVLAAKPGDAPPDLLKQGPFRRVPSVTSSRSTSFDYHTNDGSPAQTPALTPFPGVDLVQPSYFSLNRESSREGRRVSGGHRSDSGESDALTAMFRRFSVAEGRTPIEEETDQEEDRDSPGLYALQPVTSQTSQQRVDTPPQHSTSMQPPMMALFDPQDANRRFVGTPDYLAPETINGAGQDEMSDWWSLGCILFECLYGRPPFNADTPDEVFKNILARNIQWPEDEDDDLASEEAKDLMNRLMCLDPKERLGSNREEKYASGGDEIKAHPWFQGINWDTLRDDEASFIPMAENPEDTEYFDARGATMQNFAAEFEDQASSPSQTPGADYPDRPHDALSRVRSQVNAVKRNLMPLHIPPHVRDQKARRLSEPAVADDFGTFQFKNLPVLEKANKDVIQKLRADALNAQAKTASGSGLSSPAVASPPPAPSLESSPILSMPLKRTMSANKSHTRPHSPSLLRDSNNSPSRGSQPSSPLLVSFSAGQNGERRKTSSGSSSFSQQGANSLQPGSFFDQGPRLPGGFKTTGTPSPIKTLKSGSIQIPYPPDLTRQRQTSSSSPRQRSHTVGSQEGDLVPELVPSHHKRRSGVFDVSPSSSDNEDTRQQALLRVQRRRQSLRRSSQVSLADGPSFRSLDVLVCEDHPVSRLVMERLLEKLRCRTITVNNGSEAMRYAMSEIKFDIIMMEYKLPQVNGADVARMIRDTKNANSHTPIVAVTGYLKELQGAHNFDAMVEKPPTRTKLTDVMGKLCQWKPAPEGWKPSPAQPIPMASLRQAPQSGSPGDTSSPTGTNPSTVGSLGAVSSTWSNPTRGSSIGSQSSMGSRFDSIPLIISRQPTIDFSESDLERNFGGLGITSPTHNAAEPDQKTKFSPGPISLPTTASAPAALESPKEPIIRKQPSVEAIEAKRRSLEQLRHESAAESGDDEDEELGHPSSSYQQQPVRQRSPARLRKEKRASRLGIEMMRTNSQGSVISNEDIAALKESSAKSAPHATDETTIVEEPAAEVSRSGHLTPPEMFPQQPGHKTAIIEMDDRSRSVSPCEVDPDATPRPHHTAGGDGSGGETDRDPDPTPRGTRSPQH
jgi:serine/threonine-protein kinase RIM15